MRANDLTEPDERHSPAVRAVDRGALIQHLNTYLDVGRFKDASFNGLQVEGQPLVSRIVVGVTANLALIEAAVAVGAQMVIAHHGLFWKGDDPRVVGFQRARLASVLAAGLNVVGYHLPLDVHPELGNNVQLARQLQLVATFTVGEYGLVSVGHPSDGKILSLSALMDRVARQFGPQVALHAECGRPIRTVAWCTGAGGSLLREAIIAGADAYITGEVAEHHVHLARESGIALIAAGHHATERGGVMALADHLTCQFGIEAEFVEVPSPL
ncbi:MAG: Nif3-like dinuclear metal center hexameric protein [Casimicrobiaceae bacterium]